MKLVAGKTEKILFVMILLLGVFLRLWKLDSLPNGLDGDVMASAVNSRHIFNGTEFKVFQNNQIIGKPVAYLFWSMPLGSFLIGIFTNLYRQIEYGTLFSSAFVGIISIPLIYLLAKRLAGIPVALLATFFFAVSPFHLVFSRIGFTHITATVPLVVSALYLLYKIAETKDIKSFYLCGIVWGVILFNSYPIAYVVAPITIVYLVWTSRWRWLYSREFISGLAIALICYLLLSVGFAYINGSADPFIVPKESYYQWITVRLNETRQNTTISKNILGGLQMLFKKIAPSYHFGVFRIFNYPLFDFLIGFTFLVGLAVSIWRRNLADKLLVLWTVTVFSLTSIINVPQERYMFALLPVPYILSAAVLIPFFKAGLTGKPHLLRVFTLGSLVVFIAAYIYLTGYRQYFVSYASNNANMIHGLGDGDVAMYLKNNFNSQNSMVITSMQLPGVELNPNYQFERPVIWSKFMGEVAGASQTFSPFDPKVPAYPDHTIQTVNDGKIETFWYGRTPSSFQLLTGNIKNISSIVVFFSTNQPGRESSGYSIDAQGGYSDQWITLKKEENEAGVSGFSVSNLNLHTDRLRLNFAKTVVGDSLQKVEEIMLFSKSAKSKLIPANITDIVLVLALNPNFKYYGNYDDLAKIMYNQANVLFGGIDQRLKKTILGQNGEVIYKIYSLKAADVQF